ncbi:MAG: D-alanyl-D-alanine carboxypeptidase [Oscillospiraceae bacterium]|nr:D-alanyl-D-alanine carboxypeptidase [Oscillospiraceae bacterium]
MKFFLKFFHRIITVLVAFYFILWETVPAFATDSGETSVPYSYVLMEGTTGTLLYSDNGNVEFPAFHSAKLMTLLLLMEAIGEGELSLDTVVKTSANANAQQGAQIWLNTGEEITIDELVKAITVGNANDAAVAIAEAVSGNVDDFTMLMNQRAEELGMLSTTYVDPTGTLDGSITTACDIATLASELSHYDELVPYFTTWMTTVRDGKTELVSTNRMILSYNGITGMKAYYSDDCLNCLIASAERNGLTMICVILGEPDEYARFTTAREKMNIGFAAYTLYTPKKTDIYVEPVSVSGGVSPEVNADIRELGSFVVRNSELESVEMKIEYFDDVIAPVSIGDKVGRVVFLVDDEERYAISIVATENIDRMNILSAVFKLLRSMLTG